MYVEMKKSRRKEKKYNNEIGVVLRKYLSWDLPKNEGRDIK